MKVRYIGPLVAILALLCPHELFAQGVANEINSLQEILKSLYKDMMPLFGQLIGVGRALAGFAATWYIGYRVWGHIARAEPIDFYPLFRPFAIGMAIGLFPAVINLFYNTLDPITKATEGMVKSSDAVIAHLVAEREARLRDSEQWKALVGEGGSGDRALWMKYAHPETTSEGLFERMNNSMEFLFSKMAYNTQNAIKRVMGTVLQVIYAAAALCVNTLRTFNLIILSILGPLVLGISVFDGFHHTLPMYIARYINVFLRLPVCYVLAAVLGKIQESILRMDLKNLQETGTTFFSTYDMGYMIFMIIGIVSYFTVNSITDQIIHVGGGSGLDSRVTGMLFGR